MPKIMEELKYEIGWSQDGSYEASSMVSSKPQNKFKRKDWEELVKEDEKWFKIYTKTTIYKYVRSTKLTPTFPYQHLFTTQSWRMQVNLFKK